MKTSSNAHLAYNYAKIVINSYGPRVRHRHLNCIEKLTRPAFTVINVNKIFIIRLFLEIVRYEEGKLSFESEPPTRLMVPENNILYYRLTGLVGNGNQSNEEAQI